MANREPKGIRDGVAGYYVARRSATEPLRTCSHVARHVARRSATESLRRGVNNLDRRTFFKSLGGAVAISALGERARVPAQVSGATAATSRGGGKSAKSAKSKIVLVRHEHLFDAQGKPKRDAVFQMLEAAMLELTGAHSVARAWMQFVKPTDTVGIKVNCLAGASLSSSPVLVGAIIQGLKSAGLPPHNIIVWERTSRELSAANFPVRTGGNGVRCYGTDAVGYSDQLASYGQVATRLSKIITEQCTALINVPVLKTHNIAGLTCVLKNHFGSINSPNRFHTNGCNPFIADVNCLPEIRGIQRLNICDAFRPLYHKGPDDDPRYRWDYKGLIVGVDPVAVDAVGMDIIVEKRKEVGLGSLQPEPIYLETATDHRHALGTNDANQMEVIELEVW